MFYFHGTRKPNFPNTNISYDNYWKKVGFKVRCKLLEREEIFIKWIKDGSVLDLACGNSSLMKTINGEAMDISPLVIKEQKKLGVNAFVGDFNNPQLKKNYDYIVLSETLEHSSNPENIINKIRKHAKYLVISIPNSAFYRYRLGLLMGRFPTQWNYHPSEHLRYWSHKDSLDWLKAMKLKLVDCKSSNGFIGKNIWKNLLGHQICYLIKTDGN